MEHLKSKPALHLTISDCPNCGNLRNESWYFASFESKRKESYLLYLSGPLKYKGQIYLLSQDIHWSDRVSLVLSL